MHCDGRHHIFPSRLTQNRHIFQRTVHYAHSSKAWCQMNQWFQMKIILKHSPIGFMVNLALESIWISQKIKFCKGSFNDYLCTIWNQSTFWFLRKSFFFPFSHMVLFMLKICLVLVTNLDFISRKKHKLYRGPYKKHFY